MERVDGLEIPQTLEEACHPERLALLVYDMQIGILGQIEDGESVTRGVREVLQSARGAGVRTVFVRHAADLGYVPIVVTDACGTGNRAAGVRSLETLRFAGDAMLTDAAGFAEALAAHR